MTIGDGITELNLFHITEVEHRLENSITHFSKHTETIIKLVGRNISGFNYDEDIQDCKAFIAEPKLANSINKHKEDIINFLKTKYPEDFL